MPYYMFQGRYTTESLRAMVDNPQDREAAARAVIEAVGGKLHHMFFCFGQEDVVAIMEAPDDEAMAACTLAIGAAGSLAGGATTKLMTTAEAVSAMGKAKAVSSTYRPPSG